MARHAARSNASQAKPASKSDAKDDLKSLPLADVEKKLGSSPKGLTQAEAKKRLTQYGPNEIAEKKTNPLLKFLTYFWGPIPWMIEAAVILSAVARHWPDFGIILVLLLANAVVGFWEERQAGNAIAALKAHPGDQGPGQARRQMDQPGGARAGAGRRHPRASGRHRAGRCAVAGWRPGGGGPVGADRRVAARHAQVGRSDILRLDPPTGGDRRSGLCDGREHLFRQDRRAGAGRQEHQPFPARGAEDRRLSDRAGDHPGGGDRRGLDLSAATTSSPPCSSPWC